MTETDKNSNTILISNDTSIILPLQMIWKPKEDITTYELALCLPYIVRQNDVMPYEIDKSLTYLRHFEIIDHNK